MAQGIRTYGPGKFYTILDSYAYEVALDGVDEEASYEEGGGWYGLLRLDPDTIAQIEEVSREQDRDGLTREEEAQLRDNAAIIFFERSDGIVEAEWYRYSTEADDAWAEVESEVYGDDEGDDAFSEEEMREGYVISDARGGGYTVAHSARHFGDFETWDDALDAINEDMESAQVFMNVYYVNDHGNVDLIDPSTGESIESRV